jgi:hypothetical protein
MAPSIAELPKETDTPSITVPVKAIPGTTKAKPKIRRVIDEEGGKTTASVCPHESCFQYAFI